MSLVYEVPPELTTETIWVCATKGCSSICFDQEFAEMMGCALHYHMVREVRQFEGDRLVSTFTEKKTLDPTN